MMAAPYHSSRLLIRNWSSADLGPFAAMNADPKVMAYFPAKLSRSESDAMVERIKADMRVNGFGFWAVEERSSGDFIGLVGLSRPRFNTDFTPCVEIGWRLTRESWGRGYATEAASKALDIGFAEHELSEIVSFTVPQNRRSRRVMEKLGMTHHSTDDFGHPNLEPTHPLYGHVLYRINREQWKQSHRR